jgi:hypothetical protein
MASVKPKYFYLGKASNDSTNAITEKKSKANNATDLANPLFNFDASFFENMNKVSQAELAQSVPYVKLSVIDFDGKVINQLNVSFFHKQVDFDNIAKSGKHADRPLMSLKNIEVSTSEAAGYFNYTTVVLNFKLHKKSDLSDRAILGLLYPNCPLRLEYGWNSPNEFLNQSKQTLALNVVTYNIALDKTGQGDLSVECKAFNDLFANNLIGDLGTADDGPLKRNFTHLSKFLQYAEALEKSPGSNNSNDYSLVKQQAFLYRPLLQITKGEISQRFKEYVNKLYDKSIRLSFSFDTANKDAKKVSVITLHDVVYTMCNETFEALTKILPVKTFEIVYGNFNSKCADFSDTSIADFPIDANKLTSWMSSVIASGEALTIQGLLNGLINKFLEEETYIRKNSSANDKLEFNRPDVHFTFTCIGDTATISIVDVKSNLPITTSELPLGKASSGEVERRFIQDFKLPVLSLGSTNTFIKEISLNQTADNTMKAALITRAAQMAYQNPRDPEINANFGAAGSITPLTLPLEGSATLFGHVAWLPHRAFYLSTGLFMVDAVYAIKRVVHTLSSNGFETKVEFRWI